MQRNGRSRTTLVEFTNESTQNLVYKERKKLITSTDPKSNIYMNDRLTEHRQNVLYAARKLVKAGKIFAAWSQSGNILIRKTENSKIIQVDDHDNLRKIIDDQLLASTEERSYSETISHLSDYSYDYESDIIFMYCNNLLDF